MSAERIDQFYRPNEHVRTYKAKIDDRERGVRLFCTQSGYSWLLQIRSPMTLGSSGYGPDGKDFVIAGAPLDKDTMHALRDAIDAFLKEAEE